MDDGIIIWNIEPEIFWISNTFPLKYYGLLFALGILLAFQIEKRIFSKENIPVENLEKLFIYILIGILVGARLGHCFFMSLHIIFIIQLKFSYLLKKLERLIGLLDFRAWLVMEEPFGF